MLPLTVVLSPEELAIASEYADEMHAVGFEYNINGTAADITAIPEAISTDDAEALFIRMLDEIVEIHNTFLFATMVAAAPIEDCLKDDLEKLENE